MRIDRNIRYFEDSHLPYQIRIHRDNQIANESYATYEEAVEARDEIEANYRETGKITHSSNYEYGKLKLARSRYRSDDLKKIETSSGKIVFAIETVCRQCSRKLTYRHSGSYQRFLDRGQICRSCFAKDRYNELLDIRYSTDEPYRNNCSTGVKNISFDKRLSKYRVDVTRSKSRFTRFADTLDEAIAIKEYVLDFYKRSNRLPEFNEI